MMNISYKLRLRARSFLHPIRTLKALYFIHYIHPTDKWIEIQKTNPRKAIDMKWNRFYREKFPWKNPRTLDEKMTWLSVMSDTSKWTEYSDKYEVRKYIESLGLKDILTECYGVWDKAEDIDFDSLPDKFVVKCTHDCGSTVVIRDKSKMNKQEVVDFLQAHLNVNYGYEWCELHYTTIKPRVIAESLIELGDGTEDLIDYKINCIHGEPQYVEVIYGRQLKSDGGSNHAVFDLYDIHTWQPMRQYKTNLTDHFRDIPRPQNLERMIEIAGKISQGFPQVRVDLYNVNGKIYFGEMTFFSASGMNNDLSREFQLMIGDRIHLPKV